ncbi:hypothetical protein H2248_009360 [Termitomyces sp. 'cryptogamus']|nr:hypothetical protein H2248_009360 [Termitomyces sp. 'cryptogamus']
MSEWFQSIPIALDSIANATKFQHETMAAQIRFHRARHQQQKALIERLKHDFGELKKYPLVSRCVFIHSVTDARLGLMSNCNTKTIVFGSTRRKTNSPSLDFIRTNQKLSSMLMASVHTLERFRELMAATLPHLLIACSSDETRARATTSSPRSVTTPLGPNRLTLPHGQTPPNLTSNGVNIENSSSANDSQLVSTPLPQHRPTSAFIK